MLLQPLTAKLRKFHETLCQTLLEEEKNEGNAPLSQSQFMNSLQALCSALESYDYEAVTGWLNDIVSGGYGREESSVISQVKTLIESFDYTRAADLIREECLSDTEIGGAGGN